MTDRIRTKIRNQKVEHKKLKHIMKYLNYGGKKNENYIKQMFNLRMNPTKSSSITIST